MGLLKYVIGAVVLVLVAGFAFFAMAPADIQQNEVVIEIDTSDINT